MSEYQYYEWQAIDRPLTEQERGAVKGLSSHITVSTAGAWVDYSWGDFKHDPRQVLVSYFDAFLYLANWGSKTLMLRLPAHVADRHSMEPYCIEPWIELRTAGEYLVLAIDFGEDEAPDWVDGTGWLGSLAPLRTDILNGDLRLLYLAWLKATQFAVGMEIYEEDLEPPVPAGLGQLNSPLQAFVELFDVDRHLLAAAAQTSNEPRVKTGASLRSALQSLTREECEEYLGRLLDDEPHLALSLRLRLEEITSAPSTQTARARRSVGDLFASGEELEAERQRTQAEARRQRHLQELADLAERETEIWAEITRLIDTYDSKAYGEATALLVNLKDLANHRGTLAEFEERVLALADHYRRRTSLMARFKSAQLVPR